MPRGSLIIVVLVIQVFCAVFFLSNILSSVIGFAPINWQISEYIELGAAFGLVIGVVLGFILLRRTLNQNTRMQSQLRLASGAFMDVLEERFAAWGLTPAEHDVALFAIKGMSTSEIAQLRVTSEGTVKAQTNAIYRKAGVTGRPQLLSLFIEDLMSEAVTPPKP
jgi:DNA-binding CsgD family transcriptional regulator